MRHLNNFMRIMLDLDGVICEIRKEGQDYDQVRVNEGAIEKIKELKAAGHYIILQTARHMKTCKGDQGQVVAKIGKKTLDWLERNTILYDEIYFGKPHAEVYIDDLAYEFRGWDNILPDNFDSNKVNILIPMAGAGLRFKQKGFVDPKPLIKTKGKTLVEWAVRSFHFLNKIKTYRLIFIVLDEHVKKFRIDKQLKELFGNETVVITQFGLLSGQAKSSYLAKEYIDNFNKLFIFNCDTYSESAIWELIEKEDPDGILEVFESSEPRYSFVKLDEFGYVTQTAEKVTISNLASTGMYYFKRGTDFVRAAEALFMRQETQNNEFYIIPCYNEMLKSGKKIRAVKALKNYILGTPEELKAFEKNKE
jgi:capsule biosynthesis phosphatase